MEQFLRKIFVKQHAQGSVSKALGSAMTNVFQQKNHAKENVLLDFGFAIKLVLNAIKLAMGHV